MPPFRNGPTLSAFTSREVTTGAQIVFDDSEDPDGPIAATDGVWSNGITTSEHIQISSSWVGLYGTSLDSYSFQTYVHEIGHALGLGHAGDYNVTARYPYDALFANDAWPVSVMSYFGQSENSYYNYPDAFVLTPMAADIVAMQSLYGLSTTTRTGDTVYGYHSNAGGVYDAGLYPGAAYAIFDDGGSDTLDFSGSTRDQRINLTAETFSSVNGLNSNLYIARGVTIENAIGGSANDTIIQNAANNVLAGGAGDDTVSYATATAGIVIDLRLTTQQDTRGAGLDTLSGFEHLIGTDFADVLIGGAGTVTLTGGGGDDRIEAGSADNPGGLGLYGGDGDDVFVLNDAAATVDGGSGFNTVDCSAATAGVLLITSGHVGAGLDSLQNIQQIIGSNFADSLYASNPGDILIGGNGDDSLTSMSGNAVLTGGAGNDTYNVWTASDRISENPGEGTDLVVARADYTLGANLENLTLYESRTSDPYAGAGVVSVSGNWSATGNGLANVITGNAGANILSGGAGVDTLTGGAGNDTFRDTTSGLNGDTLTDFGVGDRIVITDADPANFTFSLSGNTLTFNGGSVKLGGPAVTTLIVSAAQGGGVQLQMPDPPPYHPANDFNGDGRSDMLWRADSGDINVQLGARTGGFSGAGFAQAADLGWQVAGTGDFNGDGHADILWRNGAGVITDWLGGTNAAFAGNLQNAYAAPPPDWHIAGTGDFNGDGRDDILWRNDAGVITDWLGGANGGFTGNLANAGATVAQSWHIAGTGDFNGDGRDDILWRDDTGTVTDWLGTASGGFVGNFDNANVSLTTDWQIIGTGDFNGDGFDDVLWRNSAGTVTDWLGTPSGGFTGNFANANINLPTSWHVMEIGDFNGDHRDDILWLNQNGTYTDWLSTSTGSFTGNFAYVGATMPPPWHLVSLV